MRLEIYGGRAPVQNPDTYGLLVAPSLCKAPNQINTPDNITPNNSSSH